MRKRYLQRTMVTTVKGQLPPDITAPTVVITCALSTPTLINPVPITITFSEDVTGFTIGDITVGNGTAGSFVTVNAKVYTATLTPTLLSILMTANIAAGVCTDGAGNGNQAAAQFGITVVLI